jgi:hypothetical protein
MKLSKIMLAAVASVALAAPAFAWDFSASGTTTATWNQTTETANGLAATNAETKVRVHGEGGSLALKSSHSDGAKTASVTYSLDWDTDLDESLTVAGSNKVGKWTASGSVSYDIQRAGCSSTSDNTSTAGTAKCAGDQTDNDMAAITLTDGTMTIVFGEAAHLSGQNVSSSSVAGGAISMDSADADAGAGAMIDSYQGVSLGYAVSDTMSVTVAMQSGGAGEDGFGTGEPLDGETSTTHDVSGFGLGFSGTFGPATIGFTQVSSSTADFSGGTAAALKSTSWSSMGLGVSIDLGDIKPFISYGSAAGSAGSVANKTTENTHTASEFGLTYALGSDTIVLYMGNSSDQYSSATGIEPTTKSGMELGYSTAVGPVSLGVGYGSVTHANAGTSTAAKAVDGYSKTDIEVNMGFSF